MMLRIKNSLPPSAWFMLLSALGFSVMGACVKLVSTYGIPVLEIVAARALVSAIISYGDIKRKKVSLWGNNKPWLIARGTVGASALFFVFYSVTTLPLAVATTLQYLHPVFTAILAVFFLNERIQRSTVFCVVLCLCGLLVMVYPNLSSGNTLHYPWLSIGSGVLGAIGSAVAYVIVKKLTKTENTSVIIFYVPLIAVPVSLILLGSDFVWPTLPAFMLLVFVGVFTQIGLVGLTKALNSEKASKATAYAYVQVVFSVFIGWMFFAEAPSTTTLAGGVLIILGALVNVFWKR